MGAREAVVSLLRDLARADPYSTRPISHLTPFHIEGVLELLGLVSLTWSPNEEDIEIVYQHVDSRGKVTDGLRVALQNVLGEGVLVAVNEELSPQYMSLISLLLCIVRPPKNYTVVFYIFLINRMIYDWWQKEDVKQDERLAGHLRDLFHPGVDTNVFPPLNPLVLSSFVAYMSARTT
ncbi:hypothetical protein C4564_05245 [Candidatus Microgenomates bacterium]|nr:MAG: hypothetical protein C4564_05245 [Candidatus Microgenomates bacterium]